MGLIISIYKRGITPPPCDENKTQRGQPSGPHTTRARGKHRLRTHISLRITIPLPSTWVMGGGEEGTQTSV